MCGLVTYISLTDAPPDRALIGRMTALVTHRGPDDVGYFIDGRVGLGFRRLSILDLAPSGHQPMKSRDGRYVIVFNGAIYNFVELRTELEQFGHRFVSTGDTEVLLAAFMQWGADCLPRLNGMWAFVVYDTANGSIFGARDRFGVKPLYVFRDERRILLASEIKSIRDSGAVDLALSWQTATEFLVEERLEHSTRTFYQGVESVPAGHAFSIARDGRWKQWAYWNLDAAVANLSAPHDPVSEFATLFEEAVCLRLRSDVSVGVLLSGGLDSTSIICSMARQLTGSTHLAGFSFSSAEFDETALIAATIAQTRARVHLMEFDPLAFWNTIGEHLWHQDEPVHSFVSIIGYRLMQLARSEGTIVLLNGQGADEIFAGYPSYHSDHAAELLRQGELGRSLAMLRAYAAAQGRSFTTLLRRMIRSLVGEWLNAATPYRELARRNRRRRTPLRRWLVNDVFSRWHESDQASPKRLHDALKRSLELESLPLYLRTEDRNSMAHATELRLPFLDYRIVTLAFRLAAEWKLRNGVGKHLLRESMRGRIPELVRSRAVKYGFAIPADRWFREGLREPLNDLIASRAFRDSGIWNVSEVQRDFERHCRGEISIGGRLFDLAQFSMWLSAQNAWRSRVASDDRALTA